MKAFIGFLAGALSTVSMVVGFMVGCALGYTLDKDRPKHAYSYVPSRGMKRYNQTDFLEPKPQKVKWKDLDDSKFNILFPNGPDGVTADEEEV